MNFKKITKAAFKIKNIALLAFVLIFSYLNFFLPFLLIGLAGYIYFVLQTLRNEEFQKEVYEEENIKRILRLNDECTKLHVEVRRKINRSVDARIRLIIAEKEDLMKEFSEDREDAIKQKIVEQALNLIKAYIKLITNFSIRGNEIIEIDVNKIKDRINANNRKLGFVKNPNAAVDLQKAIEMDQKMLERVDTEKSDLERVSAKLDYMESTIRMFKHRLLTSEYDDGSDIESIVNEAEALDNVLNDSRKNRLKI